MHIARTHRLVLISHARRPDRVYCTLFSPSPCGYYCARTNTTRYRRCRTVRVSQQARVCGVRLTRDSPGLSGNLNTFTRDNTRGPVGCESSDESHGVVMKTIGYDTFRRLFCVHRETLVVRPFRPAPTYRTLPVINAPTRRR